MLKFAILAIYILASSCLHHHYQSIDHLLHGLHGRALHLQNDSAVLSFNSQFEVIQTLVGNTNSLLTQKDSKKYEFLITKTSQMKAGLDMLKERLTGYNLIVSKQSKLCPGVTTFNRSELRKYITYTEQKQQLASEYLSTCLDCSLVSNDLLQIQNLTNRYIKKLNETMDGVYCETRLISQKPVGVVNLNSSYFKNNLKAKNWYYGSTTASDYKIYIFKRSSTYNLTNCPIQAPFVKDQEQVCFDCPEGSIFNLGSQVCDTCKLNQILNVKSGKCDPCLGQKKFINGQLTCQLCILAQGQLFNATSGKCYKCTNSSYLDTEKKVCVTIVCSVNTPRFNKTTKACESCLPSQTIDPNDVTKCIRTNFMGMCPPQTPRYDFQAKQCFACQNGTSYNKDTNKCEAKLNQSTKNSHQMSAHQDTSIGICPNDKPIYNNKSQLCEPCQQNYQYNISGKTCVKKVICGATQTLNETSLVCIETSSTCRPNEVYVLKINKCLPKSMTCNQHQYYNPQLQTCIAISSLCTIEQYYDSATKKCLDKSQRCKANQSYNPNLHACQKLVLCGQDQSYNFALKSCEKKWASCKQSEYYDKDQHKCRGYNFKTSPYTGNLIYDSNFKEYINYYRTLGPNTKDCPLAQPYFQKSSSTCIECSEDAPYFDIIRDKCTSCYMGKVYSPSQHICKNRVSGEVSGTIKRINI